MSLNDFFTALTQFSGGESGTRSMKHVPKCVKDTTVGVIGHLGKVESLAGFHDNLADAFTEKFALSLPHLLDDEESLRMSTDPDDKKALIALKKNQKGMELLRVVFPLSTHQAILNESITPEWKNGLAYDAVARL